MIPIWSAIATVIRGVVMECSMKRMVDGIMKSLAVAVTATVWKKADTRKKITTTQCKLSIIPESLNAGVRVVWGVNSSALG